MHAPPLGCLRNIASGGGRKTAEQGDVDRLPLKFITFWAGPEPAIKTIEDARISPRTLPMPRFALTQSSIEAYPWVRPFRLAGRYIDAVLELWLPRATHGAVAQRILNENSNVEIVGAFRVDEVILKEA